MKAEWPKVRLGWVAETIVPQRDKPSKLDGPIPWLRIEDFNGKYLAKSKSGQGVTSEQVSSMPLRVFPAGTVVCSCSCTMGATAIATQPLVTNQTFIGLVPREGIVCDFLYYLMQARQAELQAQASGAIQQYLSQDSFRALRLGLPPKEEQQRIAAYLDDQVARIDRVVASRERQLRLIEERRVAELRRPFEGGATVRLRRLLKEAVVGIVVQPAALYTEEADGIPALRGTDVSEGGISRTDLVRLTPEGHSSHPRSQLKAGDVVVVRTGDAGAAAVVPEWAEGWNCIDLVIARVRADLALPEYVATAVNAARLGSEVAASASGSIQQHFGVNSLLDLNVRARGIAEQERIVREVQEGRAEADELSRALRASIALLEEYRRSLISAAVTGEFDVTTARTVVPV